MQPQAKELAKLAAALGKNPPPKGEKDSWEKLTKEYATNAAALEKAVAAKDQTAAMNVIKKMGGDACNNCHTAHRKKD